MSKESLKRSHDESVSNTSSSSSSASIVNESGGNTGGDPKFTLTPSNILEMYNGDIQSKLISMIGVVDQVFPVTTTPGTLAKTILKWTVNNGDGERVECIAWNSQVQRIQPHIVLGNVLFLNGVFMKAGNVKYLNGTVLFQLTVQSNSTVHVMHEFGINVHQLDILNKKLPLIDLQDVCRHRKCIRVQGFIKTNFAAVQRAEGLLSSCFGVIGVDDFCLEIKITQFKNSDLSFEIGQNVEIQGFIRRTTGFPPQLIVRSPADITVISEMTKDITYLCKCVQSPIDSTKKARQE